MSEKLDNRKAKQDRKLKRRTHHRQMLRLLSQQDDHFLKECITTAEDERTATAKAGTTEVRQTTIDKAHDRSNADKKPAASIKQLAQNTTYGMCTAIKRAANQLLTNKKQVTFNLNGETHNHNKLERANTVHLAYNSGADGHYVSKDDRKEACMPILRSSSKKVRVANGNTCKAKHVT